MYPYGSKAMTDCWVYYSVYKDRKKYLPFKARFHSYAIPFSALSSKRQMHYLRKLLKYCIKINYNKLWQVKQVFFYRYGISTINEQDDIKWVLLKMSRSNKVELTPSEHADSSNKLWEGAGNFKITKVNF